MLGLASHVTISAFDGPLANWGDVAVRARGNCEIVAAAPYTQGEGMLRGGALLSGTLLRGVVPDMEQGVSDVGKHLKEGRLEDLVAGEYRIVLGAVRARAIGVQQGDRVDLLIPQASVTRPGVLPRLRGFTVSGIFEVGMQEFDRGLVLVHLADAQAVYRMGAAVDLFQAPRVSRELADQLEGIYYVSDWTRQHESFFRGAHREDARDRRCLRCPKRREATSATARLGASPTCRRV